MVRGGEDEEGEEKKLIQSETDKENKGQTWAKKWESREIRI